MTTSAADIAALATADAFTPIYANLRAQASTGEYIHSDDALFFGQYPDMSTSMRLRWLMDRAVIRRAVVDILAAQSTTAGATGPMHNITVHDGEGTALAHSRDMDQIMGEIGACDEEVLIVHAHGRDDVKGPGQIILVHGNAGWDVVADHTYNDTMVRLLAGADALSQSLSAN